MEKVWPVGGASEYNTADCNTCAQQYCEWYHTKIGTDHTITGQPVNGWDILGQVDS